MFGKKKDAVIAEPTPVIEEKKTEVQVNKTVIGPGITMVGDFSGSDPIFVEGTLKGTITAAGNVHVTKTGQLLGEGKAASFEIDGYVDGNIDCKESVSFSNTGKMKGTLSTVRLKTDDGSNFEGTLNLKKAQAAPAATVVTDTAPAETAAE